MARLGSQEPTWQHVGEYATSAGDKAVAYFAKHGARFYGSQKLEFELMLARDADGGFAAKSLCITKPRQNGKSYAARWYALWMSMVCGKRVLYSAHHSRTSRDMFKQLVDTIEADEAFSAAVKSIYRAGGYEGIYFKNGGCIEFQTRTNSGGRGGTYDIIILDEAQELTPAQQDALLPTVSAAGEIADGASEPQKIYIGTVPGPECQGTVFREMHDRVHAGESDVWWLEWGAQGATLDDVDTEDVDLWYACNPAMGRRMRESTVKDEHDTMTRDGFARERLGWWSPTAGKPQTAIAAEDWDACKGEPEDLPSTDDGVVCYAVKFSGDGSRCSLAACINPDEGAPYVQCIDSRSMGGGVRWLVDWLKPREGAAAQIVVDGRAYSAALVERLSAFGFSRLQVVTPSSTDVATACGMLVNAVEEHALVHGGQDALDESAKGCSKRPIGSGGGFGFDGRGEVDETIVEACALALWQALTTTRDQRRVARVG